jgi:hypothetical protein
MSSFCSFSPRCPKLKIDPVSRPPRPQLLASSIAPGIFPYLGGSIDAGQLRSVMTACEGAVVPGKKGAQLAAKTPGVLVDPAAYAPQAKADSEPLFDYDEWLMRQQAAGVPVILTDTPRLQNGDRSALRKALERWAAVDEPTLVVLPIEPWWLRAGLWWLTEEVRAATCGLGLAMSQRRSRSAGVSAGAGRSTTAGEPTQRSMACRGRCGVWPGERRKRTAGRLR